MWCVSVCVCGVCRVCVWCRISFAIGQSHVFTFLVTIPGPKNETQTVLPATEPTKKCLYPKPGIPPATTRVGHVSYYVYIAIAYDTIPYIIGWL